MEFKHMLKQVWIRRALWAAALLLGLWALAWLALPPLLKSQAERAGSEALGRKLSIGAVDFKPWSLELTLSDIALAAQDGKSSQLTIKRVYLDAEIQSLWRLAPVVDAVTVEQPHLTLAHLGDGHYDFDDILQRLQAAPAAPTPSAPLRFALYNLLLSEGAVDFTDHVGGAVQSHTLRNLNMGVPFLSSFDSQREVKVAPFLAFELNGSRFDSAAQATPFAADAKGEATLQVAHLDITPYLPYLPASLPVRPKAAVLDSSLKIAFTKEPSHKLVISGAIKVSDIQVDDKAGAPLLKVAGVQTVIQELLPLEQKLTLESLTVTAPALSVHRTHSGQWNLPGIDGAGSAPAAAKAAAPKAAASAAAAPVQAAPAWQVALGVFQLEGGQVRLHDESSSPAVDLVLKDTVLQLRDLHLPQGEVPASFEASALLQANADQHAKSAKLALQGKGTDAAGNARFTFKDMDLALGAPYRAKVLIPRATGVLEGELVANWKGDAMALQAPRLALHDFALTVPPGNTELRARDLPSFQLLELGNLQIDLAKHAATLEKLVLNKPVVRLARGEDGQWMYTHWLVPTKATANAPTPAAATAGTAATPATPASAKYPAWTLNLAEAALGEGSLTWVDRQPAKPVFLELSQLQSRMRRLTLDGNKPAPLTLSAKVRGARSEAGSLRYDGSVMWAPVVAQGTLDIQQFPAQALAPYGLAHMRLDLLRADTSFKGQFRYAALASGTDLLLQGDAAVEELALNSASKSTGGDVLSEPLLNWKALSLPGIDLKITPGVPMALKLREVSLSDFFARLIVDAQGRLVLQDIARRDDAAAASGEAGTPAQAPASAVAAIPAAAANPNDPVIEVGGVRLVNGHVAFSDRFIKPNYSADLTELSGSLGRFSSRSPQGVVQMADLDLRGRAEGTASLEIAGKVNPLAKPLALDIHAKVRDLELSPLSSYAIKYAGYGIERGKLSVDLNYVVSPDGRLQASNKIVLNQLVFGDAVAGAPASLPVKLAVALLADSNGVIDLDVPLSGSLNDPQFRVWPLVWKVVGNLVVKALTSPFSLISGLLGGGNAADEMSNVAFDAGTTSISAAALPSLDKVAKALRDKPSLRLTVVGTASQEREREAMQHSRLGALLLAEKRRQAASAGKDVTAVAAVTEQEYPDLLKSVYKRSDLKKPRNLLGLAKDLPTPEMEALLLANQPVDEDAVRALALNRSLAVREYLTAHQVPAASLFLGVVNTAPPESGWQPRVELSVEHH
jgi:hypothetical protein